jgi:hypothetical protein
MIGLLKYDFLTGLVKIDGVSHFWGQPGNELLAAYHQFSATGIRQKNLRPKNWAWFTDIEGPLQGFGDLGKSMDEHYDHVPGLFDTAIAQLDQISTDRVPKRTLEDDSSNSDLEGPLPKKRICVS